LHATSAKRKENAKYVEDVIEKRKLIELWEGHLRPATTKKFRELFQISPEEINKKRKKFSILTFWPTKNKERQMSAHESRK
jgi:hypothetical protein